MLLQLAILTLVHTILPTAPKRQPRLRVAAYVTRPNFAFGVVGLTAEANGLPVETIGMGRGGEFDFTARFKSFNTYLSRPALDADDIVLFVDGFETVFFGGEDEIVKRFVEVERKIAAAILADAASLPFDGALSTPLILFNAEPSDGGGAIHERQAASAKKTQERIGVAPNAWQHLNSGLVIGRARALHWLFNRTFNETMPHITKSGAPHQYLQKMLLDHPRRMALDYTGELFLVAQGIGGIDDNFDRAIGPALASSLTFDDARRRVKWTPHATGSGSVASAPFAPTTAFPSIVLFPGAGHWARRGDKHCFMVEAVRRRYPLRLAALGFTGASGDWEAACNVIGADRELAKLEGAHAEVRALSISLAALGLCCAGVSLLAIHFRWRASSGARYATRRGDEEKRGRGARGTGEGTFELVGSLSAGESDDGD